jgi:hypothetical protein
MISTWCLRIVSAWGYACVRSMRARQHISDAGLLLLLRAKRLPRAERACCLLFTLDMKELWMGAID